MLAASNKKRVGFEPFACEDLIVSMGETICEYLKRMVRVCDPQIKGLVQSLASAKTLLSLHSVILQNILRQLRPEYLAEIQNAFSGNANPEFWDSVHNLHMLLHLQKEILEIAAEHHLSIDNAEKMAFERFWGQCREQFVILLQIIKAPSYLCQHWQGKLENMARHRFIQTRSRRLFDYILDYPDSRHYLLELKLALLPGSLNQVLDVLRKSYIVHSSLTIR
jgi:hypothetical protein